MKLITELIDDDKIEVLIEENKAGKKDYYIKGVFMQSETKNRNGRVYPKELLQKEVAKYNNNYVKANRAFGELGHPDGPIINLERVSHMIKDLTEDGNNWVGKAKLMDTPYGKIAKSFIDEGATLGVSSRGMGSLKPTKGIAVVQDDFYLATAADIVADPSAPDAFVEGMMEGREWVWENGMLKERNLEELKRSVERSNRREREAVKLAAFDKFLSKL